MKRLAPLLAAAVVLPGCHCAPGTPAPITLRVKNATNNPIWVDDSTGQIGLEVQQGSSGNWTSITESLACSCLDCSAICGTDCECDAGLPQALILEIPPGGSAERQWGGTVESPGVGNCGFLSGPQCFSPEIPPGNQVFNLHLVYSPSGGGTTQGDAGQPVPGSLEIKNELTVDKTFKIDDGEVEIGPLQGPSCQTHADCADAGQLCFNNACTSACPANDVPPIGGGWQVDVLPPSDNDFLVSSTDAHGNAVESGDATITSVQYNNGITTLYLSQPDGGVTGMRLDLQLPTGYAEPFVAGQLLSIKYVDASANTKPGNHALVMTDGSGNLLLAADMAELGPILAPADLSPLSVAGTQNIVACDEDPCGKVLHLTTVFSGPAQPVELSPGHSATIAVNSRAYTLLNVANNAYTDSAPCALNLMPYLILFKPQP